jgi:uncharacterized protein (TIGR02001 family)
MRKTLTAIMGASALALAFSGPTLAADMPVKAAAAAPAAPDWDIAFGGGIMSDYLFRGITQSNHSVSPTAYFEPHYKEFYAGIAGSGINWPSDGVSVVGGVATCAPGHHCLNSPSAEVDLYGGWRPTVGKWSFDLGYIYYLYPGSLPANQGGFTSDFGEAYGKATYALTDALSVGGSFYYSPNLLNYHKQSEYYEINAKYTIPSSYFAKDWGAYISGAWGYFAVEKGPTTFSRAATAPFTNFSIPSYSTWNVGWAFTYKVFTLDLRYSDTSIHGTKCIEFWNADPALSTTVGGWCRGAFAAKLSFDLLANTNLK